MCLNAVDAHERSQNGLARSLAGYHVHDRTLGPDIFLKSEALNFTAPQISHFADIND